MKPLQNIAILSNASQKGAEEAGLQLKQLAEDHGIRVKISEEFPVPDQFLDGMDACFVMGGDGTLLSLLEQGVRYGVPVAGVRYGKLGFLATFSPEDLEKQMPQIFNGHYKVGTRSLLSYQEKGGDTKLALNDLVVKSGSNGRLARFSVFADDEPVADYACDGIVFSTPTGSTAYSLSARGPVVSPTLEAMLLTPLAPHMLFDRSLVLGPTETIRIDVDGSRSVGLAIDGQEVASLEGGESVTCSASDQPALFVRMQPQRFHQILKAKFGLADR